MTIKDEALKLALEALEVLGWQPTEEAMDYRDNAIDAIREALADSALERMAENARELGLDYEAAQQQEPVAFDKTEINCFAQDLYDQKMREGKHGHYESMFHVIHQCIKKVSPPASKPWVGLTDEEIQKIWRNSEQMTVNQVCRAIEAKLREKNNVF